MRKETQHANLRFFVSSNLCFETARASLRFVTGPSAGRSTRQFEECLFLESVLWLELGTRYGLFERQYASRYLWSDNRVLRSMRIGGSLEGIVHRSQGRHSWPFPEQVDRLFGFLRDEPIERSLEDDGNVGEELFTDYSYAADYLAGEGAFMSLSRTLSSSSRDAALSGDDVDIAARDVLRALEARSTGRISLTPAVMVAGLLRFLAFVSTVKEILQDHERSEPAIRVLSELAGIQYWRLNLRRADIEGTVSTLLGALVQLARETVPRESVAVENAASLAGQARTLLDLWKGLAEGVLLVARYEGNRAG